MLFSRTIASALHFIKGLQPNSPINPAVDLITKHPTEDYLTFSHSGVSSKAPDYYNTSELLNIPQVQGFSDLYPDAHHFAHVFDILATTRCHNLNACITLKHQTQTCLPIEDQNRILSWADKQLNYLPREFIQSTGQRVIDNEILAHVAEWKQAVSSSETYFRLFAGHDTTLGVLLRALGHDIQYWPPYASHVTVEAWWNPQVADERKRVQFRVFYNGEPICKEYQECQALTV
jgi:hypothetical protein